MDFTRDLIYQQDILLLPKFRVVLAEFRYNN